MTKTKHRCRQTIHTNSDWTAVLTVCWGLNKKYMNEKKNNKYKWRMVMALQPTVSFLWPINLNLNSLGLKAEDLVFQPRLRRDFSGSSHTSDLKTGIPVATLPGAWCYRVSVWTGWPDVSILWLGEMESLIRNFCLSVAARTIVWADPSLRYTIACCWDFKQPTNKQINSQPNSTNRLMNNFYS